MEVVFVPVIIFLFVCWLLEWRNAEWWQRKAEREEKTAARYFALLNPEDE